MATTSNNNCLACSLDSVAPEYRFRFAESQHTCEKGTGTSSNSEANTFSQYQDSASYYNDDDYPEAGTRTTAAINDAILGLANKTGEIVNEWAKYLAGRDKFKTDPEGYEKFWDDRHIESKVGDVLWYVSQLSTELGVSLRDVAAENIRKLRSRSENGTLQGSGDDR